MEDQYINQRAKDCQSQRTITHRRRVPPCKFGDELLGLGLAFAGILDELQNFGSGGFIKLLGSLHAQKARYVHGTADDLIARLYIPGQALAGQRAGVERRDSFHDHTVDRNFLARPDHDDTADLDLVGIHLLHFAVLLKVRVIGPDVHQLADAASALADGYTLEKLADLVKEHYRHGFRVLPEDHRADRRHRHQKALVKNLMIPDSLPRLPQHIVADSEVGNHKQYKAQYRILLQREKIQHYKHNCCRDDAQQQIFLFLCQVVDIHIFIPLTGICFLIDPLCPSSEITGKSRSRLLRLCSS